MAEQFHDGELKVVRGREDISYHEGADVSTPWKWMSVPQHAQRMTRPVLIPSAVALVRKSSNLSQPSSPYPCTSISTVWPALNAARRAATAASDVSSCAVKVTGYLVVGIEGIDPLSKSNGIETARTSTPASDACDSSLTTPRSTTGYDQNRERQQRRYEPL